MKVDIMNSNTVLKKLADIKADLSAIMSDAELDWLIDNDLHPSDVVSIRNPHQVGLLDAYLVAKKSHPVMQAEQQKVETLTSATRTSIYESNKAWDEPQGASSARGWYWPKGSTIPGKTLCAGHYLDYGPGYRYDQKQIEEPGTIHCVVISMKTGLCYASKYVESVEAARAFIETEAIKAGHSKA